jgi:hypothetical protein
MKDLIGKIEEFMGVAIDASRYLLVGNAFGKRSIFLYKPQAQCPFVIAKIPGTKEGQMRCENEYRCMEYLNQKKIAKTRCAKALGIVEHKGQKCYLQETLFSKPLYSMLPLLTRIPMARYFRWGTERFIGIYQHSREPENIKGKSYARCYQHGDAWPGNLGRDGDAIVLYDLEFGSLRGKPLFDLLHFGLYYQVAMGNTGMVGREVVSGNYDRGQEKRNFQPSAATVEMAFLGEGRLAKIMRRCIHDYINTCQISREDARALIYEYISDDRGITDIVTGWDAMILSP